MRDFPIRAWVYTAAIVASAVALIARLGATESHVRVGAAFGFGLLFLLTELAPFQLPHASYSVSFVIAVAALTALGPAEAAIAACFGALDLAVLHRKDRVGRAIFNGAQLGLSTAAAGVAYIASGGPVGHIDATAFPRVFVPIVATAIVYFVTNTGLVAGMISLVRRVSFFDTWSLNYLSIVASTFAFAVVGVLLAALYAVMGLISVVFVVVPLVVARRALQAAIEMDEAYDATLRGIVHAIETKDAYTRGHAERVSQIAEMIAREMGLPERKCRMLRIAALMHDVGKLVVSTTILQKPGKLTAEEYEHMKSHPLHGFDIVSEIDFLRDGEAVNAVRHHHERMDGRGYPDGLAGEEIPMTARIVMVADAFDSMTSTRTYRLAKPIEDGLKELNRCAGVQFDANVIAALERALQKNGWEPAPEEFLGEQVARPEVSVHAAHA
jgi:HD-GYP domain-containing protein (c-di-GMP phosphodiesterase class II)